MNVEDTKRYSKNVEKEEIRNDIETEHKDSKSNTSVET